jgi:hypothetical protein
VLFSFWSDFEGRPLVKVLDWQTRSWITFDDFFERSKQQIISQIGTYEFELVKQYAQHWRWPDSFKFSSKQYKNKAEKKLHHLQDSLDRKLYDSLLNRLKMYKIAVFDNLLDDGKTVRKYAILRVPFSTNREWDKETKWDTVYFILRDDAIAEVKSINSNPPLVKVLDWQQRGMINGDDLYEHTKDEIIRQIGAEEFVQFEKHDDIYGWPTSLRFNLFDRRDTTERRIVEENFKKLKVYKIATYNHVFDGKDWGKYVILKAPYTENSFLDSPGKWDAIYFLMKEKYVQEIQ